MCCTGLSPFYHEFKKQIAEKFKDGEAKPNFAMTFSFGNENDPDNIALEVVDEMFKDYANFTGISFTPGNKTHGEAAYFEDVTDRAKRGVVVETLRISIFLLLPTSY